MKKWIGYAILAVLVGGVWLWYGSLDEEMTAIANQIKEQEALNDPDLMVAGLKQELMGLEGARVFQGILLAFLSAGLVGVVFVLDILPIMAQKVTHAVYDSDEMVERDPMHDARALFAQGEYEQSIEAYRVAASKQPENKFPWVEIAKIQNDYLHDPEAAVETLRNALEQQDWEIEDAAFFLFRLCDLYDVSLQSRSDARVILEQVIELFPETRHSANARHKLNEWDREEVPEQPEDDPPT